MTEIERCVISIGLPVDIASAFLGDRKLIELMPKDIIPGIFKKYPAELIICPLFCPEYGAEGDATALIKLLKQLRYNKEVVILSPPLPSVSMVEKEMRAIASKIHITVVAL